jgi:hypothetical protein
MPYSPEIGGAGRDLLLVAQHRVDHPRTADAGAHAEVFSRL